MATDAQVQAAITAVKANNYTPEQLGLVTGAAGQAGPVGNMAKAVLNGEVKK